MGGFRINQEIDRPMATCFTNRRILRSMVSSKAYLLLRVLCVGLTSVVVVGCGDHHESFYQSLADADKAGAITHGWIPDDLLPAGSRAIHEVHKISPSIEWCAFEFSLTDSQGLRKNLKSVDALPPSVRRVPSPGASWWPAVLKGNLDVEKIRKRCSNSTWSRDLRHLLPRRFCSLRLTGQRDVHFSSG